MRLGIILLLCATLAAQADPVVLRTIGQSNSVKFQPGNANRPGFSVEVMQGLERIDPDLQFKGWQIISPIARIEAELVNNQIDVFFGLMKTPDRQQKIRYIDDQPLYIIRHQIAVRKNDTVEAKSFDDIRTLGSKGIVLTLFDGAFARFLKSQGGLTIDDTASTNDDNMSKLLAGRGRFFYQAGSTLARLIADAHLEDQVRLLPTIFHEEPLYLALSKQLPTDKAERLARALRQLAQSGDLARLQQKYNLD